MTEFVAAEFGQGDDAVRTRALLRDLAADANTPGRPADTASTGPA